MQSHATIKSSETSTMASSCPECASTGTTWPRESKSIPTTLGKRSTATKENKSSANTRKKFANSISCRAKPTTTQSERRPATVSQSCARKSLWKLTESHLSPTCRRCLQLCSTASKTSLGLFAIAPALLVDTSSQPSLTSARRSSASSSTCGSSTSVTTSRV